MGSMGTAYPRGRFPSRVGVGGRWRELSIGLRRRPFFRSQKFTGKYQITGVTRNSTGSPLGNCIVLLFKWSPGHEFVEETVSDGSGNFTFTPGRTDGPFQIVAYKDGAPDVSGTTVNEVYPVVVS